MKKRVKRTNESAESIIRLVSILHYISAVFLCIIGFIMIVVFSLFWNLIDFGAIGIPVVLMILISVVIFGIGVFQIFVAGGILRKKEWARVSGLALGIFSLFSFPVGTLIGIITIYFIGFNKEVIGMFR